ncbi:MAG: bifunctional diaminohydroxyphosphoribosylaminopyrimidine deaminase/5-amino-6-(5-phosphoribosylamino)uracil reductase RibD [Verrucomicrobiota bacterium]|nr:bifunctional diaminohydroxyphosphoribosylaminopyrimidine deaminase/5-amino-6-(5-phosphoribosylamino)uracil reductase RibD [Verrucomicrobiota bacterium]
MLRSIDRVYMREALALADRGRCTTWPNPRVGALVVSGGRVVGRGFHRRAGESHAEIHALQAAGGFARGATLYVTLEPCSSHGRTGPCTEAVLAAGVRRVVMALVDPDPRHQGRAVAMLRDHGVEVDVGCMEPEARAMNAPFLMRVERGRPLITAKQGMSADARVAYSREAPGWFTGPEARRDTHRLRGEHPLIITGIGTVLADDPVLTVRDSPLIGHAPARLVIDSHARLPLDARILASDPLGGPVFVGCLERAPLERVEALQDRGVTVIRSPENGQGRVDLADLSDQLGRHWTFNAAWLECGPALMGAFLDAHLIDGWVAYLAPCLVGGAVALPALLGQGASGGECAPKLTRVRWLPMGRDLRLTADVLY